MGKQKKMAVKLTVSISSVLVVIFAILIAVIAVTTQRSLKGRELEKLELLAQENANIAKDYMETMINKQESIVAAIETMKGFDMDKVRFIEGLLNAVGAAEEDILSLFYVSEPNALIPGTPAGMSVFTSAGGVHTQNDRFAYVDEAVYQDAVASGQLTVADPFPKTIDGENYTVITVLLPVHGRQGEVTGMVGSNIDIDVLMGAPYNHGGYVTFSNEIICGHKTVIFDSRRHEDVGKAYLDVSNSKDPASILQAAVDAKSLTLLDTERDGSRSYRAFVPFYVGGSSVPWLSGTSIQQGEFQAEILKQVLLVLALSLAGLVALVLFCLFAIHRTLRPLAQVEEAIRQLAAGNLDSKVDYHGNDEIGRLAASFNLTTETVSGYIRDIGLAMGEMAGGNFDVRPSKPFIGDFASIERSISNFVETMCRTLVQMNQTAKVVEGESGQLADGSTRLSEGAAEQAASIQELNEAVAILARHVKSNDELAREAGRRVKGAGEQLEDSSARMGDMTHAMNTITENSEMIQQVIKTIEDIAFQTNILALNAAIEAARAGKSGKGFSVVADEVRTLAARSGEAAKSTAEMIQRSLQSIDTGSDLARQASKSLDAVQEKAASVMEIVDEICAFSHKQLEEIENVSQSTAQISEVVQMNSATAEESAATAEELASQSQMMRSMTSRFKMKHGMDDTD